MKTVKKITFSLGLFLMFSGLLSLPRPYDPDESGRVQILKSALSIDTSYLLYLVEDFEGERPWDFYRVDSFLAVTQFAASVPKSEAFLQETTLLKETGYPKLQNQTSFLLQSYVENPRLDHWEVRPKEPILLPLGMPIQGILWVYSEGHHINLSLGLSQKKSKDLYFDLGTLNFVGWRRLEFSISLPKENTRLIQSMSFPISFASFRLKSLSSQKKGEFHLYFDNLSFVIDKRTFIYPGSEVNDTWGNKR
ncbi:flagellar filament outer layer protein FlaA [Leptospira sp. 2 VSF19]|uniref:Flagellar filament outer layer protein FlaA n=1 Tax=Leptospira soteropolitanensis TaxID=2950025 RepID=A0AAW5VGZ2_9LEPT|nr:flagellar filament outer layer protein FlaA [Leptospira soteropolitanensis]MCW7492925.1 flagellar filament outer layer protein FlaA [Leptospira soteropolitanensis]MCW7500160.1 flagellar filament outer layer protein FlaA [Leptospira soteropolitanensis]MCW7522411.1 flagellar filament outer layer protein FlaA [Leptospira soteropolitanensis]MCW7526267.1 flagellar filament outer layer protein FlaA [Leptospira soteropolitanensis]MCW7529621.1 flagellar filament outer layer protein FlaA [Leptospira